MEGKRIWIKTMSSIGVLCKVC